MNADTDKIAKRVKKMLDLAESTSFAEEADTAIRMARALMAKHNLSLDDVSLASEQIRPNEYLNSNTRPWCRACYSAAAKLNGCDYIISPMVGSKIHHIFIGLPHNTKVAYLMGGYFIDAIRRMCREEMRSKKASASARFRTSYCIGAAGAIQQRVDELVAEQRKAQPDNSNGKDLVVMNTLHDRALAWTADNMNTRDMPARRTRCDGSALAAGFGAGLSVSLAKQID